MANELTIVSDKVKKLSIHELIRIKKDDLIAAIEEYKSNGKYKMDSLKNRSKGYPIYDSNNPAEPIPTKYIAMLAYNKIVLGKYMCNKAGGYSTDNFEGGISKKTCVADYFAPLLEGTDYYIDMSWIKNGSKEYHLDSNWVKRAMKWFVNYVITQQKDSNISFDSGWLKETEGYKKEIFINAHKALQLNKWEKGVIGSGIILKSVINAFKAKDNLGFNNISVFYTITKFEEIGQKDLKKSEEILYRLYTEENPSKAFEEACKLWGKRFPELSYLLFMKDSDKFIPVKTDNHKKAFEKLGIDTKCLNECSWKNYQTFLQIHEDIRSRLEAYLGIQVSLLDAHSFVWIMKKADLNLSYCDETIPKSLYDDDNPYESTVITCGKEGRRVAHYVTKYERNPLNREEAIRIHGYRCVACEFDFEEKYGELGKGFVEVHHIKPLYSLKEEVEVNPATDLVCLCANCHRMIHRKRGAVLTIEELKEKIKNNSFE